MKYTIFQPKKPIFLLHICSKSSTFAGLFAKGHFSSLPIVLSFSSLPLPPVLFLPVVWQVFRLLSRPRRFAGSPRNLDFWGAFPREHIPAFTPYTLHFTPYSTGKLGGRGVRSNGSSGSCPRRRNRSPRATRCSG